MDRLKVSVAMCTYQGASFVAEQLESIFSQSRQPDELVISDDASTDTTLEEIGGLIEHAPVPVRLRSNETTLGYRRNFELAVRNCSGDVIFLADQDDVWLQNKVEKMLSHFADRSTALVHCDAIMTDAHLAQRRGTIFARQPALGPRRPEDPLGLVRGMAIPGCTMAIESRLVDPLTPFSELWGHDLWIALIGGALGKVVSEQEPLMLYRRHSASSGPSRFLDTGPLGRAAIGFRTRHHVDRPLDLARWHEVVERLEAVSTSLPQHDPLHSRLAETLGEYRRRSSLAAFREEVRRRPRLRRIGPVLGRIAAGDYARYLRPVTSPLKDVLG